MTRPGDGEYSFRLLTTNDVHGSFFDSTYLDKNVRRSLFAVKHAVDSIRAVAGSGNVVLIDAGDILQGDNAAYYFDYVDTLSPHIYPRMAAYMGYDAVVAGNHDIETGHPCYDRVAGELKARGIPFLSGNAVRNEDGKPYFPASVILKRNGLKIAVLGFNNANIKNWLSEKLWSGMTFENLIPLVQENVDAVIAKEKPQIVIVAVHSATGRGDGTELESQGLDLMKTLRGVDFLVCGHDHRPVVIKSDTTCLINAGSHCRFLGEGSISLSIKNGKIVRRSLDARLLPVDMHKIDREMAARFHADYLAVKKFTITPVGELKTHLWTRDAYAGQCDYTNLIHTLSLSCSPARISFAAPLTYNGHVKPGTLVYNDLFTIYPYENQLYVVNMTGREIKDYLEASYDRWIVTVKDPSEHVLKIAQEDDPRTGQESWSFTERAYNFDSAGGLDYTVDVTKPEGRRVSILSLSDGEVFDESKTYPVAMTSYRASGGGGLLMEAGVDTDKIGERIVGYYPEMREILYGYLKENHVIDPSVIGEAKKVGRWRFVPDGVAESAIDRDLKLLFPRRGL